MFQRERVKQRDEIPQSAWTQTTPEPQPIVPRRLNHGKDIARIIKMANSDFIFFRTSKVATGVPTIWEWG